MVGVVYDLIDNEAIYQGADWYKEFQFIDPDTKLPYNLTGFTVRSHARKKYTDSTPAITFICTVTSELNGIVRLSLSNTTTASIVKDTYTYDVELIAPAPSNAVSKGILPSIVEVREEYTK